MIIAGTFMAKAAAPLEWVKAPKTGNSGVEVLVQFTDGPNKGQTLKWVGWLGENTIVRTEESLTVMGYDGEVESSVMTKEFSCVVELESYDKADGSKGERPRIKWINDPSRTAKFDPMASAEVAGAKQRLKAAALAAKKPAAAVAPEDEPKF